MAVRTTTRTVTFNNSFSLAELDEPLPAGTYKVETDEELLEGVSFPVYRRVLTLLHLQARADSAGLAPTLKIDPKELDAALKRDQALAEPSADSGNAARTIDTGSVETIEQANERGEDEGMLTLPSP